MEPNTLVIKNDIKSEVQQEVLAEGTINPVLPGLHIPAIDVIEYFREAAGLALHSKIKFRQTPDINMPIKVKIFIPKPPSAFVRTKSTIGPRRVSDNNIWQIYEETFSSRLLRSNSNANTNRMEDGEKIDERIF